MSGKQHKRELKRQKRAAREAARRRERRRSYVTVGVIGVVIAIGAYVGYLTVDEERRAAAQQQREVQEQISEMRAQASEQAARQSELEAQLPDREVACGGERPAGSGRERPTFSEPEQVIQDGVDYQAVIETSCGEVTIDLAEEEAPGTVNSFVFLANQGFFDGLEIFRNATTIGALQTGAGGNEATWDVGYQLEDELDLAREEGYPPGAVAMANSGPNTAGSQFFFVYNDQFDAAFGDRRTYTRFAMVTEGLDVVEEMGAIEVLAPDPAEAGAPGAEIPSEVVFIEDVTILADGEPMEKTELSEPAPTDGATGTEPTEAPTR